MNEILFDKSQGELTRVGYVYSNPLPKSEISKVCTLQRKFKFFSEIAKSKSRQFKVMTIGTSFSERGVEGYNNYLAHATGRVLHYNRFLASGGPVMRLMEMTNGDFFDSMSVDYVILESVERYFIDGFEKIDLQSKTSFQDLVNQIKFDSKKRRQRVNSNELKLKNGHRFFYDATIKAPMINLLYNVYDKPWGAKTYKVPLVRNDLFSSGVKELLFTEEDILALKKNNKPARIKRANNILNKLSKKLQKKNIELIVLVCPDKYDLYYPYIEGRHRYEKPVFFQLLNELKKDYQYVNSKKVLSASLEKDKNVYYYDDAHWSPVGAKIIAEELEKVIK